MDPQHWFFEGGKYFYFPLLITMSCVFQRETGSDLGYDGISRPVSFLNLVARVALAALANDVTTLTAALAAPELSILDLEPGRRSRYAQAIIHAVRSSAAAGAATLPSHTQLQELVDDVNAELNEDLRRLEAGLEKTRVI
jgi:hypothetical protein